jgi:hypothetical protein
MELKFLILVKNQYLQAVPIAENKIINKKSLFQKVLYSSEFLLFLRKRNKQKINKSREIMQTRINWLSIPSIYRKNPVIVTQKTERTIE